MSKGKLGLNEGYINQTLCGLQAATINDRSMPQRGAKCILKARYSFVQSKNYNGGNISSSANS